MTALLFASVLRVPQGRCLVTSSTSMASTTEEFAARARSVFGSLGKSASTSWKLDTQQGFKPGAEDGQDSSDEEEGAGPQPLEGAAGSDEEGIEQANQYHMHASCAYVRAFEQEEEEDEFDRQAAGSGDEGSRPLRSMEVLEDNAFDRMHRPLYSQQLRAAQTQHHQQEGVAPSPAAAGNSAAAEATPIAMDVDDGLPHLEANATALAEATDQQQGLAKQGAAQVALEVEIQQQQSKRLRTGFAQVWLPPQLRPDYRPPGETALAQQQTGEEPLPLAQQQQQRRQQQRKVRFADGGPTRQQQQNGQGQGRGRNHRGRGRGRGTFVPDHVKHPHKYTVYTLDEPLYVGQGGQDDTENERAAAAAGRGIRVNSSSGGSAAAGAVGSKAQEESATDWMDDTPLLLDPHEPMRPSVDTEAATAAGSEAAAPVQPPAAGTIRFQPRSKRICAEDYGSQSALNDAAAANAVPANAVKHLGAVAEDEDPSSTAAPPSAVQHIRKGSRQYRTRHADEEDA